MKFVTFDIETAALDVADELKRAVYSKRFGITCAALYHEGMQEPEIFRGEPQMTKEQSLKLLARLLELERQGYAITTWNGTKFDFQVLAQETEKKAECAELAMRHVDAMLFVTFSKGFLLSLEKAATGAGLKGKLKSVTLKNGGTIQEMSGGLAPSLWAKGEYDAVTEYLKQDVLILHSLIKKIEESKAIQWTSQSGKPMSVPVKKITSVAECFELPLPDTSWMNDPPTRESFIEWMKEPRVSAS